MHKTLTLLVLCLCFPFFLQAQELIVNWTKFIGGSDCFTEIAGMASTADGGVFFTGSSNCSNQGYIPATPWSKRNLIVGKISNSGDVEWVKIFGGSEDDDGIAICKTHDGKFLVLGKTQSPEVPNFRGGVDIWLLKMDESGNVIWSKTFGSPYADMPGSIALTPDNGFIVQGGSNGYGDDVPSHHTLSQFVHDWFIFKIDEAGNKQWAKSLGGTKEDQYRGKVIPVDTCYYLISGSDSKDFDCSDNSWQGTTNTLDDCYVLKLNNSGDVIWSKSYGGSLHEVSLDAMFDPYDSTIVMSAYSLSDDYMAQGNYGALDLWIVKIDMSGTFKWGKKYGGTEDEYESVIIPAAVENMLFMLIHKLKNSVGRIPGC